jgi:ribonuclease D
MTKTMTTTYQSTITKEELNALPQLVYESRNIIIVDTLEKSDKACEYLEKCKILGFDTETKPAFARGVTNKVALIQLSAGDTCWLFRVNIIGIPLSLARIISNKNILKVGLSLRDDYRSMAKRMKMVPQGFIDLQSVIKNVGIEDLSLQKMYGILFEKKISKSQRLTNWEAPYLTEKQQMYAAIDAWACVDIYNKIKDEL